VGLCAPRSPPFAHVLQVLKSKLPEPGWTLFSFGPSLNVNSAQTGLWESLLTHFANRY